MKYLLFTSFICFGIILQCLGQCTTPSPIPVVACGTGTPLSDNANINSGQTYYATGGSYQNINIGGGTLVLCGTVIINNLNFNSGWLIINPNANITFNGNFSGSTNNFYNSGTVTFNSNIAVQGTNTFVYNAAGASITVNGGITVFNSGLFINNGTAWANTIDINSGASICLGPNSVSGATNIQNNQTNAVSVPVGTACLSYTGTFTGNNPITASPGLIICRAPSSTAPNSNVIGSATVVPNCSGCQMVLPVRLVSFQGKEYDGQAELDWVTAMEDELKLFAIEESYDGSVFRTIDTVNAQNRPSSYHYSTRIDDDRYFRLKMVDIDGRSTYSPVILLTYAAPGVRIAIHPNPITDDDLSIVAYSDKDQNGEFVIMDMLGRNIKRSTALINKGNNSFHLDLNGIGTGQYYLFFVGAHDRSKPMPFVKI